MRVKVSLIIAIKILKKATFVIIVAAIKYNHISTLHLFVLKLLYEKSPRPNKNYPIQESVTPFPIASLMKPV
jgi:hypothetical protein